MLPRLLALALALAALAAAPAAAQVLYIGDSLGVGTAPPLREQLGGVAIEVDAKTSRPSGTGVEILAAGIRPEHEVVVFDLGTNDDPGAPQVLAADLARAREIAGDRCLVVATINRPPLNGVDAGGLNRAVVRFALGAPGVELVDWRSAVGQRAGLLTDGVHATPEGYALRAQLFAEAIGSCLDFATAPAAAPPPPRPRRRRSIPSRRLRARPGPTPTRCARSPPSSRGRLRSGPSSADGGGRDPRCGCTVLASARTVAQGAEAGGHRASFLVALDAARAGGAPGRGAARGRAGRDAGRGGGPGARGAQPSRLTREPPTIASSPSANRTQALLPPS